MKRGGGHAGDVVAAMEDAVKWTMEQDDAGDIIFFHRETQVGSMGMHVFPEDHPTEQML